MLITSTDNRRVRLAVSLNARKQRDDLCFYLVEGPNLVREALEQDAGLQTLFFLEESAVPQGRAGELKALYRLAEEGKHRPEVLFVSRTCFDRICETRTSQGVVAIAEKRRWSPDAFFAAKGGNILVLDRIQDPGNLGTLLRTAEAAGFSGAMLLKGCGDVYGPKAVRAAAGTLFRLPLLFPGTPPEAADLLRTHGKQILAAAAGEGIPYFDCPLTESIALVIGNEGNGISDELAGLADRMLSIPMEGLCESLNAALAGGIIMYEALRQRRVLAREPQRRQNIT